jgi:hypothetical protein
MSGATITQMPTLCVPEKLNKQELIDQVIYLQKAIFQQGQQLHEANSLQHQTCIIANHLASQLHALMDSFDAGDQAAILLQLKELAESRTKRKAKVH